MAPSAGAVVVVANTHCTSFGIQNVCAMAFGVHPGIHDFFRRNAAPCGILASSGIRHAVLAENSVPLGTIGTNVRIDGCDLFGALLSGLLVTELVYYYAALSYVLPVIVGVMFTLLHALIQAYVLTMLVSTFYGESTEKHEKKPKAKKMKESRSETAA